MLSAFKRIALVVGIGVVFASASAFAQSPNVLVSFKAEAGTPRAKLLQGSDGNLYGTALQGGVYGLGSVFAVTPAGDVFTVHSFIGPDGANPASELIQASDGYVYGTHSRRPQLRRRHDLPFQLPGGVGVESGIETVHTSIRPVRPTKRFDGWTGRDERRSFGATTGGGARVPARCTGSISRPIRPPSP